MTNAQRLYDGILVSAQGVTRSFGQGNQRVDVLRGVDLQVQAGEVVALFGASGSGKTTLLNIIGALDMPTNGTVTLCDHEITNVSQGKRSRLRRQKIGFIFQNYTLLPTYSAAENIDLVLRLPNLNIFERRKRIQASLEAVGLSAWSEHLPAQLSGGQQQRVAIARALALRPALILADEPTSGLDSVTAKRILTLLRGIAAVQGTAFLVVSHDPTVEQYTDRAYNLHEGRLQQRQITTIGANV